MAKFGTVMGQNSEILVSSLCRVGCSSSRLFNALKGGGCYLHMVPLVTSFRRLNTPSTCLPWVASRLGGRRDPGG